MLNIYLFIAKNGGQYIGCFRDNRNDRDMNGEAVRFEADNTPSKCIDHCLRIGNQVKFVKKVYGRTCISLAESGAGSPN